MINTSHRAGVFERGYAFLITISLFFTLSLLLMSYIQQNIHISATLIFCAWHLLIIQYSMSYIFYLFLGRKPTLNWPLGSLVWLGLRLGWIRVGIFISLVGVALFCSTHQTCTFLILPCIAYMQYFCLYFCVKVTYLLHIIVGPSLDGLCWAFPLFDTSESLRTSPSLNLFKILN